MGMTFPTRLRVVTTRYYTVEPLSRHPLPSSNSIATCQTEGGLCQRKAEGRNGSGPALRQQICALREDSRPGLHAATLHGETLIAAGKSNAAPPSQAKAC